MKKQTNNYCLCEACQRYYSISSIADKWDVSQKTIRRMINSGKIQAKRIGGSIRIPHSELAKIPSDF
jgi:excisionase family DNA binding protein